jgi:hypothetical protein
MQRMFFLVFLTLVTMAFSQGSRSPEESERVDSRKPTIYLSYVCQDEKNIYLRMNNNTIWHVSISAEKSYFPTSQPITLGNGNKGYAIPSSEEVPLHYFIERDEMENIKNRAVPKKEFYYQNRGGRIPSKDSILFSVPIEHLRKGLKIHVEFNYEWEIPESGDLRYEPKHRVYFRGGDVGSANTEIEPTKCQKNR